MLLLLACAPAFDPMPAPDGFTVHGPGGPQVDLSQPIDAPCAVLTGGPEDAEHHNLVGVHDGWLWMPWAPESGGGGITAFDFHDPCDPVKAGEAWSPIMRESHTLGIGVVDGRTLLAVDMHRDATHGGIGFWDITDPAAPTWRSELELPGYFYPDAYFRVALSTFWLGDRLYVASGLSGIFTVDVSDPDAPEIIDQHQETAFIAGRLQIVGDIALGTSAGLSPTFIWDVGDPDNRQLLARFDTQEADGKIHPYYFASVGGPWALFARKDGGGGPMVYDISDPAAPVRAGSAVAGDGDGGYVYRHGDLLFQGESNFGARYDFTDPAAITEVGRVDMAGDFDTLTPIGNVAVASVDEKGDPGLATQVFPWSQEADRQGPSVGWHRPAADQTGVAATTAIGLSFDENIEPVSAFSGSFRVWSADGEAVPGRFYTQETIVNFVPDAPLDADQTYLVEIPAGGITDVCGNPTGEALRWRFSTGQEIDGDFPERL